MKNKIPISIFIFLPMLLEFPMLKSIPMAPVVRITHLIIVMYVLFKTFSEKKEYTNENILIISIFSLLTIISLLSTFKSGIPFLVIKRIYTVLLPSYLLIFLIYLDSAPEATFNFLMKLQMYMGVIFSIYGILLSKFGKWEYLESLEIPIQSLQLGKIKLIQRVHGSTVPYRIASFMGNPNGFGLFLVWTMLSTLYLYKMKKNHNINTFFYLLVQFIAILLTQSRTAFLTLIIAVTLYYFIISEKKARYFGAFLLIIPLFLLILGSEKMGLNIAIIKRFQNLDLSGREDVWKVLIDSISENYLMGIGFSTSYEVLLSKQTNVNHTHNVYLKVLTETGVIGFITLVLAWATGIIFTIKKYIKNKNNKYKYLYAYILTILIVLLLHQMAEEHLMNFHYIMFLWVYSIALSSIDLSASNNEINYCELIKQHE